MLPFGIQPIHLVFVAIVALLIFGPAKLPEIGRGVGRALNEFRKGAKEMTGSFMEEVNQGAEATPQTFEPQEPGSTATIRPAGMQPATIEQAAQANYCIHCGKSNPSGAIYCNQCGQKVAE